MPSSGGPGSLSLVLQNPSRTRPLRSVILAVCTLLVATTFLAACSDKEPAGPQGTDPVSEETPEFAFEVDNLTIYPTVHQKGAEKATADQVRSAEDLSELLALLYSKGFLDPVDWRSGDYAAVYDLFDQASTPDAKAAEEVLTAGAKAGATYDDIQPGFAHLNIKLMTDEKGEPINAVGIAEFHAVATAKDGQLTTLISKGQFFFNPVGKGWEIYAFDVDRTDQPGDDPAKESKPKNDVPEDGSQPEDSSQPEGGAPEEELTPREARQAERQAARDADDASPAP